MHAEIIKQLRPVRGRLTRQRALPRIGMALLAGGWLALVAALLTLFGGSLTSGLIGVVIALGIPLAAFAWSLYKPASWQQAAQLVDRQLHLHNRTSTALHLSQSQDADPMAALQVEDALSHLRGANLSGIKLPVPWERLASGAILTLFAIGLIIWGVVAPPTAAIQTSGDMQDLRPEVQSRQRVDFPVTADALSNTATLETEWITQRPAGFSPMRHDDVAKRYFDAIGASP